MDQEEDWFERAALLGGLAVTIALVIGVFIYVLFFVEHIDLLQRIFLTIFSTYMALTLGLSFGIVIFLAPIGGGVGWVVGYAIGAFIGGVFGGVEGLLELANGLAGIGAVGMGIVFPFMVIDNYESLGDWTGLKWFPFI